MIPLLATLIFVVAYLPFEVSFAAEVQCDECHSIKSKPSSVLAAPYLAGQHPDYIVRQFERFAAGDQGQSNSRSDQTMSAVAHALPRDELRQIANALSAQECVNLGNDALATLAPNPCASCHGPRGLSSKPGVPNLAGQNMRYLFAQYQKFREQYSKSFPVENLKSGESRRHPVMGPIAAAVSDNVVTILNYYSKLPCR